MEAREGGPSGVLGAIVDGLRGQFSNQLIYGQPVSRNGVTVIPAASLRIWFAGGGQKGSVVPSRDRSNAPEHAEGDAGGGTGIGRMKPAGFIEITDAGARWVPVSPSPQDVALRLVLLAVALFLARRGARRLPFAGLLLARRAAAPVVG